MGIVRVSCSSAATSGVVPATITSQAHADELLGVGLVKLAFPAAPSYVDPNVSTRVPAELR